MLNHKSDGQTDRPVYALGSTQYGYVYFPGSPRCTCVGWGDVVTEIHLLRSSNQFQSGGVRKPLHCNSYRHYVTK